MNTFDPAEVRKAVAEFTPRRPQKFQDLIPAREVIVELRQKSASYRSIADLLTQHCLPTSKTAVAMFCHQVLGENIRPTVTPFFSKDVFVIALFCNVWLDKQPNKPPLKTSARPRRSLGFNATQHRSASAVRVAGITSRRSRTGRPNVSG
jgi:hypothetical protein